jgi:small subunit ribosomal protein S9
MMADEETPEKTDETKEQASEAAPSADAPTEPGAADQADERAHAVPPEAQEIASVAEDAPLEALEEAEEAGGEPATPQQPAAAPGGEGHAVPTDDAIEVAAVAEDAPLEALQEAQDRAAEQAAESEEQPDEEPAPSAKPSVPGAHLEVDIVPEGVDPLGRAEVYADPYAIEQEPEQPEESQEEQREEEPFAEPISTATIDLGSGARYRATGKRKTAIARVTLRPGSGTYLINGRTLEAHFPRDTLQRNIRQPLETVGYQERMDVVARLHGGGISAQAGALRHGVSRALLEADPNLRGELKRRGFLTRDPRVKERKKAGLKKARKRPQFSKR